MITVDIVIPKMVRSKDLADFFSKAYSEYKGKVFVPKEIKFIGPGFKDYKKIFPINSDCSGLRAYAGGELSILYLYTNEAPTLRIYYLPDSFGYPTIYFDAPYIYPASEEEAMEARAKLNDILAFAKLLMKYTGAAYFYGGLEVNGEITSKENTNIEFIYCKGKEYVEMLKVHFKNIFGVVLSENLIEKVVKETATVQEEGTFRLITFFRIKLQSEPGALFENPHYAMVKKLLKNGKK
jgi:hypothetical protein